ncbi:MAG: BamA/TamA family outer membrane protein [Calditrichaeota bacterium]|nr:BamA/TamA family outer membrane protein [Calditrichota bacterium]
MNGPALTEMRSKKKVSVFKYLNLMFVCCLVITLLHGLTPIYGVAQTQTSSQNDSLSSRKSVLPERHTWEKIADIPGRILFFPLKYAFKGIGISIGYVDHTKIVPKINDFLESDDGRREGKPTYNVRTGFGGIYKENGVLISDLDRNNLTFTATVGPHAVQLYQAEFEELQIWQRYKSDFFLRYWNLVDEQYYGLGNGTLKSAETEFALEQTTFKANVGTDLQYGITAVGVFGFEYTNIANSAELTDHETVDLIDAQAPGVHDLVMMYNLGFKLSHDSKDMPGNPTRGYEADFSAGFYNQYDDDRFSFFKYSVDAKTYINLFYKRILALRVAAEVTNPISGKEIPFYYMSSLGRTETIRGFERGRYRDRDMLVATAEYRWPVWRKWEENGIDAFLFVDSGQVMSSLYSTSRLDGFKTGYGFGFRLWSEEGLMGYIQAGWSEETFRFYVGVN